MVQIRRHTHLYIQTQNRLWPVKKKVFGREFTASIYSFTFYVKPFLLYNFPSTLFIASTTFILQFSLFLSLFLSRSFFASPLARFYHSFFFWFSSLMLVCLTIFAPYSLLPTIQVLIKSKQYVYVYLSRLNRQDKRRLDFLSQLLFTLVVRFLVSFCVSRIQIY